jgi:hypothetical protein
VLWQAALNRNRIRPRQFFVDLFSASLPMRGDVSILPLAVKTVLDAVAGEFSLWRPRGMGSSKKNVTFILPGRFKGHIHITASTKSST